MAEGFCEVSIGGYDGDQASVWRSHKLKARTTHTCYECECDILVGARYERINGKWDDEWRTYSFCLACSEIANEFSDGERCYGMLWESMNENWDEGAHITACLNRLSTVSAKKRLHDQWLRWKDL